VADPVLNESGMTELHLAVYHGDPEWVAACIAGGMDLTARSGNGYTPLHWAVSMGCVGSREEREAVVRALVAAGADPEALDLDGHTVRQVARFATSEYLLPLLGRRPRSKPGK
jgi:ankyrin repeat protein